VRSRNRRISSPMAYEGLPRNVPLVSGGLAASQMGVVSGGDIVLGENHKTGQNRK